jgi:hypothetical protein
MSVASVDPGDLSGGHVKIGAVSHWGRNLGIAVAALVVAGAAIGLTRYNDSKDAATLGQLETFRAAYAEKCDVAAFRTAPTSVVKDAYLRSAPLREAIAKQQVALQSGAPCDEIGRALKAADYPLPAATTP